MMDIEFKIINFPQNSPVTSFFLITNELQNPKLKLIN